MNTSTGIDGVRTASLMLHGAATGMIRRVTVVIPVSDLPASIRPGALDDVIQWLALEDEPEASVVFAADSATYVRSARRRRECLTFFSSLAASPSLPSRWATRWRVSGGSERVASIVALIVRRTNGHRLSADRADLHARPDLPGLFPDPPGEVLAGRRSHERRRVRGGR